MVRFHHPLSLATIMTIWTGVQIGPEVCCPQRTAERRFKCFEIALQVIQRRGNYGEPRESFNRNWEDYKYGFGAPEKEFWMGNENIHMLTRSNDYELRIEMEDFDGNKRSENKFAK